MKVFDRRRRNKSSPTKIDMTFIKDSAFCDGTEFHFPGELFNFEFHFSENPAGAGFKPGKMHSFPDLQIWNPTPIFAEN